MKQGRGGLVYNKIRFSVIVILLYLVGKKIPIPWAVVEEQVTPDGMLGFLRGMLGTASMGSSVLELGLQPYIAASIFTQFYVTVFKKDKKDFSQTRVSRATKLLALIIAVPQAVMAVSRMQLRTDSGVPVLAEFVLSMVVLIAGAFIVIYLSDRIQERGLGGQSMLILVNMLDNYRGTAYTIVRNLVHQGRTNPERAVFQTIMIALMVLLVVIAVVMFENAEIRVPIHRGIMNNTLTEVDYVAIKLNPAGSMPIMYVMTVFSLPYYVMVVLNLFFPMQGAMEAYEQMIGLNSYAGLAVFIALVWALTIAFAVVTVNPDDIADSLQKQGDYILGIPAGRTTKLLLRHDVTFTAVLSSLLLSVAIGGPIAIRIAVQGDSPVFMLPMNLFIMVSIFIRIYEEARVLHLVEDYKPFL